MNFPKQVFENVVATLAMKLPFFVLILMLPGLNSFAAPCDSIFKEPDPIEQRLFYFTMANRSPGDLIASRIINGQKLSDLHYSAVYGRTILGQLSTVKLASEWIQRQIKDNPNRKAEFSNWLSLERPSTTRYQITADEFVLVEEQSWAAWEAVLKSNFEKHLGFYVRDQDRNVLRDFDKVREELLRFSTKYPEVAQAISELYRNVYWMNTAYYPWHGVEKAAFDLSAMAPRGENKLKYVSEGLGQIILAALFNFNLYGNLRQWREPKTLENNLGVRMSDFLKTFVPVSPQTALTDLRFLSIYQRFQIPMEAAQLSNEKRLELSRRMAMDETTANFFSQQLQILLKNYLPSARLKVEDLQKNPAFVSGMNLLVEIIEKSAPACDLKPERLEAIMRHVERRGGGMKAS